MAEFDFQLQLLNLQDSLFRFAFRLTLDYDDAQDLLQDTTIKALTSKEKFNPSLDNFKAWVFTIMRNLFINNVRRDNRTNKIIDYLTYHKHTTHTLIEDSLNPREITEIINSFPDSLQKPLLLYIEGYKYEEIAEELKQPLGTIKSKIFQARKIFKEEFGEFRYRA